MNIKEAGAMWGLAEAVELVQELEGKVEGYHLGVTGSVLYKGWSNKDLDIIVYPRSPFGKPLLPKQIIERLGMQVVRDTIPYEGGKKVITTEFNGRRIDLFFLQ